MNQKTVKYKYDYWRSEIFGSSTDIKIRKISSIKGSTPEVIAYAVSVESAKEMVDRLNGSEDNNSLYPDKMETTPKYMDLNEFVDTGILHEINRLFLHPLGLAMPISEDKKGEIKIPGIWDCRNDPEGIIFSKIDWDKVYRFAEFQKWQFSERSGKCGFYIQEQDADDDVDDNNRYTGMANCDKHDPSFSYILSNWESIIDDMSQFRDSKKVLDKISREVSRVENICEKISDIIEGD